MRINVEIGSEWHTTNWAKGFVFVYDSITKKEEHIYKVSSVKLIRKEAIRLIGNKGKHGNWNHYTFDVNEGTILKLFTQSNEGLTQGYFKVNKEYPLVKVYGEICHGNGAEIEGQLEWLSPTEFNVDPKYIESFDKDKLTIETLLEVNN